jgi:hypothetical protein
MRPAKAHQSVRCKTEAKKRTAHFHVEISLRRAVDIGMAQKNQCPEKQPRNKHT